MFWVLFLLKDTRCFEKTKDCIFEIFVSFFKFCFLKNFILHFLHQFGAKFLCKLIFLSRIWGFILCKESFRARNCWDLQLCFIFLCIRIWFLKLPVFYSKQVVNRRFFWNVTTKLIFGLLPCIGNQVYCGFLPLCVNLFSLGSLHLSPELAFLFPCSSCQRRKFHS